MRPAVRPRLVVLPALLAVVALTALGSAAADARSRPGAIKIRTLSNRADLISGGNALVRITLPRHARVKRLKVTLNGRRVTAAFSHRTGRTFEGVVEQLRLGRNRLVATAPRARGARLTITNHPN